MDKIIDNDKYRLEFRWCDLCEAWYIKCPKCGNNSCNGAYGTDESGKKCQVCPKVYDLQSAINESSNMESIYELLGELIPRCKDTEVSDGKKKIG